MYVVPYLMGPPGSPLTKVGVEITDSIYVVLNMRIMSRMGQVALDQLGDSDDFNRGLHSVLDCNPERRFIAHFPQDNTIISVGSGYGGNVLLGKKCLALRIGSYLGRNARLDGRAHADPRRRIARRARRPTSRRLSRARAARRTSPCSSRRRTFKGWKITTVGDDIAWMKPGPDGRLYAINPEAGYFGVAPGTNYKSNPNAMQTIATRHDLHERRAHARSATCGGKARTSRRPRACIDWKGNPWTPDSKEKAAHPNSRFTAPMTNNPALAPEAQRPAGRADQRDHLRRTPRDARCRSSSRRSTGSTASISAPRWAAK